MLTDFRAMTEMRRLVEKYPEGFKEPEILEMH